jgi:hypothetical protein
MVVVEVLVEEVAEEALQQVQVLPLMEQGQVCFALTT